MSHDGRHNVSWGNLFVNIYLKAESEMGDNIKVGVY
jgi:hypothetical protein